MPKLPVGNLGLIMAKQHSSQNMGSSQRHILEKSIIVKEKKRPLIVVVPCQIQVATDIKLLDPVLYAPEANSQDR